MMPTTSDIAVAKANGTIVAARAYIRSMRLYYSFITGLAGWIGVAFAVHDYPGAASVVRIATVLLILFLAWGVNQVINDYLGLPEDRINAPHRPMVTGELNSYVGLAVSLLLIAVSGLVTLWLSPHAMLFFFAAILFNVIYEYAKSIALVGNVVFGVMIAFCTAYGYIATADVPITSLTMLRPGVLLAVAVMNGLMTYYTYFKDIKGDEAAGRRTAVVVLGPKIAGRLGYLMAYLPLLSIWVAYMIGWMPRGINVAFLLLLIFATQLQLSAGRIFRKGPTGYAAYSGVGDAIRACACGMAALLALADVMSGILLFVVSFIGVDLLFSLHKD